MVSAIDGVELPVCERCGGEGNPPCLHEDTGRKRPGHSPCDVGLQRTSVTAGTASVLVSGQGSFCTSATSPDQCGYVGQNSCNGECLGRSAASEDGLQCVECGGPGQGTCAGPNQDPCDAGLLSYQEGSLGPICVCPVGGCNTMRDNCREGAVISQSGGGTYGNTSPDDIPDDDDEDVSADCGDVGQRLCTFDEGSACASRLLPDEDGTCVPCGDAPGDLPCEDDDPPRCGFRLVLNNDFCESCGGPDQPVCCDKEQCTDDPDNTACDKGLFRTGSDIGTTVVRTVSADAYCSPTDSGNRCGLIGQPPCPTKEEDPESTRDRPCSGLSVPSLDRTLCVACGRAGDLPCYDREKFCTGQLITVFDTEGQPIFCLEVDTDVVVVQSHDDCGRPGMIACENGTPCVGSNIQAMFGENGMFKTCNACGGPDQLACSTAEPCEGTLRLYDNRCVACGGLSEPVCPRPEMGPPCNTNLQPFGTTCEPAGNPPPEEELAVLEQSFIECGSDGAEPCPGQPACGDLLFLVEESGALKCSSTQPGVYSSDLDRILCSVMYCVCCCTTPSKLAISCMCILCSCGLSKR